MTLLRLKYLKVYREIAAISGHRTLKEIERYTAAADQVRLSKAAMAKLRGDKKRT
jgi:hypothetical protein